MRGRRLAWAALVASLGVSGACGGDPVRPARALVRHESPEPRAEPSVRPETRLLAVARPSFPRPGAEDVCADAVLSLSFETAVALGASGTIRVLDVDALETPADEIDLAATSHVDVIGGRTFRRTHPVAVEANTVRVRLRTGALRPNRTYAVLVADGVFVGDDGRSLGALTDAGGWRFTTRAPAPQRPSELVVAPDGSGDFCSVQGALDFVPARNAEPVVIHVKRGTYREIVFVENKWNVRLRGEDRRGTLVADTNNERMQNNQGSSLRALASFENVGDFVIENLTLHNTTPQGGSQAEALRLDPGERVIVRNANLLSRQDTLLLTGRVVVSDSYVEGNVDYVWGKGTAYFERVELKTVGRPGWNVQARNPAERFGYVFVDSLLSAEPGVTGHLLARIDVTRFPASHVAYVDCRADAAIADQGWEITPAGTTATSGIRFWEYGTRDLDGAPLDLSKRHPAARKLTKSEAATMRDKQSVLGGWDGTLD